MEPDKNIPWCEKHRISCFSDVKGQELAIDKVKNFLRNFPAKKAVILHGPAGTGKTSLAYAIAFELEAEIIELNASDLRNKEKISSIVGPASQQMSLFKKNKIILLDEVDGISARDRGGLSELISLIELTGFPMIMTANDIWDQKFSVLRQKCELVQLKEIDYKTIVKILMSTSEKEGFFVSADVITSIAIKSRGDIRAAINDIQMLADTNDNNLISREITERDKEQSIFAALQYVFKNCKIDEKMLNIFEDVNLPIDDIFLWIEENIPHEYHGIELARAFEALSKADVFRGRIIRQQYWRFMVYEYFLLGAGVASSKSTNRTGWTSYKRPSRILKIWLNNQRTKKKKTICKKYARYCHINLARAMQEFMLIKVILKNTEIRKELDLSDEEIEYLDKPIV